MLSRGHADIIERLAETLERLLADAFVAYVAAPDRFIRDLERGGHRRAKKSSRPTAKPAPTRTTTAANNPAPTTTALNTTNPAPEQPAAPNNPTPYTLTSPEPPNPHNHHSSDPDPYSPNPQTTRPNPIPTKTPGTPDNRRPPNNPR